MANSSMKGDDDKIKYVHRLARDVFHPSIQLKLERSDELEEEGFHPVNTRQTSERECLE